MDIVLDNKKVSFSEEETEIFKNCGLELNSGFLKLLLHWIEIDDISSFDEEDLHNKCIEAICSYNDVIKKTLDHISKERLL